MKVNLDVKLSKPQWQVFLIPHRMLYDRSLMQGGFGSGKSYLGVIAGVERVFKYPGIHWLVTADTYKLLRDTTRELWKKFIPSETILSWTQNPDVLILRNGSRVYFRHADLKALRSFEFGGVHIEEGSMLTAEQYREIVARVRQPVEPDWPDDFQYRILITTNPQESSGWLDDTFARRSDPDESYRYVIAPTWSNPHATHEYIGSLESTMPEEQRLIYIEGQTGNLGSGYVYYKFDRQKHIGETQYNPNETLCLTMDFNVSFMYAAIAQVDKRSGKTYVIDEIAQKRSSSTSSVCEEFIGKYGRHLAGVRVYGDPSGYSSDTRSAFSDYDIVRRMLSGMPGLLMMVARNDSGHMSFRVKNRAMLVNKMLEDERIVIDKRCRYLIKSLSETQWAQAKGDGWQKDKDANPNSDKFVVDHPGDALDYFLWKQFGNTGQIKFA